MLPFYEAAEARRYKRVFLVCGAQMSKTEALLNLIGKNFADNPRPAIYVGPTEKNVRSMSLDRVGKMIASTPVLAERLAGGNRDKVTEKWIGGARCGFAWGSSATELASHPAALVLVDERDRMGGDVDREGDPVTLAEARTKNYRHSLLVVVSTPTVENGSPIWALWEEGTRGMWSWVCPHCEGRFIPRLSMLAYDDTADLGVIEADAGVGCPHCGALLTDEDKTRLNAGGAYLYHAKAGDSPMEPELPSLEPPQLSSTASFWISGLASPWVSFGEVARQFEGARRSHEPERLQGVVNTWGGELYRQVGDRPAWQEVEATQGEYAEGECPGGVQMVVAGVDVQRNRLYWCVRGFGHALESWLLGRGEIFAETDTDEAWIRLGHLLGRSWGQHSITTMLVDSGYKPGSEYRRPESVIYSFARRYAGTVFPSKGFATQAAPLSPRELKREGIVLVNIDTDHFKTSLYNRIRWPLSEAGAWHTFRGIDEDYCRQLTAEEVVITPQGKRKWVDHNRDNHFFDCEVLCLAAARFLSLEALPEEPEERSIERAQIAEQFGTARKRKSGQFGFHD